MQVAKLQRNAVLKKKKKRNVGKKKNKLKRLGSGEGMMAVRGEDR